jgi:hypothetical protein
MSNSPANLLKKGRIGRNWLRFAGKKKQSAEENGALPEEENRSEFTAVNPNYCSELVVA